MKTNLALGCMIAVLLAANTAWAQHSRARWIWYPEDAANEAVGQTRYFRKTFDLPDRPERAELWILVDDRGKYWVNGQALAKSDGRQGGCSRFRVPALLRRGRNVLAVQACNASRVAGVIGQLWIEFEGGDTQTIFTDKTWRTCREQRAGWTGASFDDSKWPAARELGDAFMKPWSIYACYDTSALVTDAEIGAHRAAIEKMLARPESFADEKPARASIGHENGSAVVTVNGRKRPAVFYRATADPFDEHGRRQIANFAAAGIHLHVPRVRIDRVWTGPGKYDFSSADAELRGFLSADPEAYLIVMVRLIPPNWWMEAHPDEWVRYAKTDKLITGDELRNVRRASLASDVWLRDTCSAWRALVRHIERQPWGKRVIGWHPAYGIYGEWHYFGSWTDQMPDTGEAMTRTFRKWLRAKYGSEDNLRRAWNDPKVSFSTASVPGVEPRENGTLFSIRDPRCERRVMDYYECQQQVTADCLDTLGRIVKDETGGRCLHGAYYGYFFGVRPQTQGGHLELERLLQSKNMDYFVAPFCYAYRLMGQDARLRSPAQAFRLAGKVHILEGDIRTHLHPRNEYGRTQNLPESLAAIRREFTTALTEGAAFWFVDFGPDGRAGWFDHPAIMSEIAKLQKLAAEALTRPRHRTAQVGVVCDLKSGYCLTDAEGMDTARRLIENVTTELYHTGAPFDVLFLSQLPGTDLSRYKLLIFLNTFVMSDAQVGYLARLREKGRHVFLWLWLPGLVGPNGISAERASRATGFNLDLLRRRVPGKVRITTKDSPLAASLPKEQFSELIPSRSLPLPGAADPSNWYNPRDEQFMRRWFRESEITKEDDAIVWIFDTDYGWNDIHVLTPIERCDGLSLELRPQGKWSSLRFKLVIIDRNGAEFVTPQSSFVGDDWTTKQYAIAAFSNARWSKQKPVRPAWPLRGIKLVLNGTARAGKLRIGVRRFARLFGETKVVERAAFGDGIPFGPVLAVKDGHMLGVADGTEHCIFAAKDDDGNVFLGAPFAPRELLAALIERAGVHRYDANPGDVVRADSWLLVVHTKSGGQREILLPSPWRVFDAFTNEMVGSGRRVSVTLPPTSTTIWKLDRSRDY